MKVRDVMSADPVTCDSDTQLHEVTSRMRRFSCTAVVVVRNGEIAGIVTDHDIARRVVSLGPMVSRLTAGDIMSSPLVITHPDDSLEDVMKLMADHHIHHLPVLEGGRLAGILAQSDVTSRIILEHELRDSVPEEPENDSEDEAAAASAHPDRIVSPV